MEKGNLKLNLSKLKTLAGSYILSGSLALAPTGSFAVTSSAKDDKLLNENVIEYDINLGTHVLAANKKATAQVKVNRGKYKIIVPYNNTYEKCYTVDGKSYKKYKHKFSKKQFDAVKGNYYKVCSVCGYKKVLSHKHEFTDWIEVDNNTWYRSCNTEGLLQIKTIINGKEKITEVKLGNPQVIKNKKYTYKGTKSKSKKYKIIVPYNDTYEMRYRPYDGKSKKVKHKFKVTYDKKTGNYIGTCKDCGYKVITKHVPIYSNYISISDTYHYRYDTKGTDIQISAHNYSDKVYNETTDMDEQVCKDCGHIRYTEHQKVTPTPTPTTSPTPAPTRIPTPTAPPSPTHTHQYGPEEFVSEVSRTAWTKKDDNLEQCTVTNKYKKTCSQCSHVEYFTRDEVITRAHLGMVFDSVSEDGTKEIWKCITPTCNHTEERDHGLTETITVEKSRTLNQNTTDDNYEHYDVINTVTTRCSTCHHEYEHHDEPGEEVLVAHTGYPSRWSYDVVSSQDYKECSDCGHRKYQAHTHDLDHATSIISCTYKEATGKYTVKYVCSCGATKTAYTTEEVTSVSHLNSLLFRSQRMALKGLLLNDVYKEEDSEEIDKPKVYRKK